MLSITVRNYLSTLIIASTISNIAAFDIVEWLPTSWVARHREESSYTYPLGTHINHIIMTCERGTITVDTWSHQKITLHMIKNARSLESAQKIHADAQGNENIFTITIEQLDIQTYVELNVVVPFSAHVTIICKESGDIKISHAPQHLVVSTMQGSITITSERGETIDSSTDNGNIAIHSELFGQQSSILARAPQGSITLHMPASLNAELVAKTQKGTVEILYPFSIEYLFFPQFDKQHLKKINKNVQGTIGQGGPTISLQALHDIVIQPES